MTDNEDNIPSGDIEEVLDSIESPESTEPSDDAAPEEAPDKDNAKDTEAETEEAKDKEAEADEDDPEFEIGEGDDAKTVKLSALLEGYEKSATADTLIQEARQTSAREQHGLREAARQMFDERNALIEQMTQMQAYYGTPPDTMLDEASPDYNPAEYYTMKKAADARYAFLQDQSARRDAEMAYHAERDTEAQIASIKQAWPEFATPEVRADVLKNLHHHYGIDEALVGTITDHRFFTLARDALAHRKATGEADVAAKKIKAKPRPVRTSARGGTQKNTAAMARLQETGDIEDAVDALEGTDF